MNAGQQLSVAAIALLGSNLMAHAAGDGERVYTQSCASCHGADGIGAMPGVPDFVAKGGPLAKPDAELLRTTIDGLARLGAMAMPARGGNPALTDAELRAALVYIRRTFEVSQP